MRSGREQVDSGHLNPEDERRSSLDLRLWISLICYNIFRGFVPQVTLL